MELSELLPHTAKQAHRMAIVRGLNSQNDDHGIGTTIMLTGRKPEAGITYPHLGAVAAPAVGVSVGAWGSPPAVGVLVGSAGLH